jgi:hypothetical protein
MRSASRGLLACGLAAGASITFAADSVDLVPLLLSPATVSADTIALGLGGEGPGASDQFQARFVRAP